jgi:ubiquinone/menaquinone biosynthesis C-methylase UbiE
VVVELAAPWAALTPDAVRHCAAWFEAARITGIRLRPLDGGTVPEPDAVEQALCALEDAVGDLEVVGLPDDDVIAGHRVEPVEVRDPFLAELRRRHLRRRIAAIRDLEEMLGPPPSSDGDATLIDPADDFLPRHPELLALPANAIIADIGCSAGRTSRRLAPHVGPHGMIIGVEKERLVLDIGRGIAQTEGVAHVQARRGLAQRLPLPDAAVDAVVCDWTFNLLLIAGIADAALAEMVRIVKPGGRIAVMQALARFGISDLANALVYGKEEGIDVLGGIDAALARRSDSLSVVHSKLWFAEERSAGRPLRWYRRAHLPRVVDPVGEGRMRAARRGTLCYSVVAEKRAP